MQQIKCNIYLPLLKGWKEGRNNQCFLCDSLLQLEQCSQLIANLVGWVLHAASNREDPNRKTLVSLTSTTWLV